MVHRSRPDVSAIVLRVDSPGGDAMASDHIYHAVEAAVKKKPVVVSMGSYAASGGYYVAAPAQKIFAQPLTLTGSIGVYALSVNAERALQKLKIGRFDVRRGDLQNGSLLQAMNEAELLRLQEHIDDTYRQFLEAVANVGDGRLQLRRRGAHHTRGAQAHRRREAHVRRREARVTHRALGQSQAAHRVVDATATAHGQVNEFTSGYFVGVVARVVASREVVSEANEGREGNAEHSLGDCISNQILFSDFRHVGVLRASGSAA